MTSKYRVKGIVVEMFVENKDFSQLPVAYREEISATMSILSALKQKIGEAKTTEEILEALRVYNSYLIKFIKLSIDIEII